VAASLPGVSAATAASVLEHVAARFDDVALVAEREAERRQLLVELAPLVVDIPWLADDIHDLDGLCLIADHLRARPRRAESSR
jgi:hypothetical protein